MSDVIPAAAFRPARVAGIMIVENDQQVAMARRSREAFINQNYPEKILFISNCTKTPIGLTPSPIVVECQAWQNENITAAKLFWEALKRAGDCADAGVLWRHDEWSDPNRISLQLACASKASCVMLGCQVRFDVESKTAAVHQTSLGIDQTMLFPVFSGPNYPHLIGPPQTLDIEERDFSKSILNYWRNTWGHMRTVVPNWFGTAEGRERMTSVRIRTKESKETLQEFLPGLPGYEVEHLGKWYLHPHEIEALKTVLQRYGSDEKKVATV